MATSAELIVGQTVVEWRRDGKSTVKGTVVEKFDELDLAVVNAEVKATECQRLPIDYTELTVIQGESRCK